MAKTIALSGGVDFAFQSIDVNLGGNAVTLRISYVTSIAAWALDVYQSGVPLFAGAMLRASADILAPWNVRESFGAMTLIGSEPTLDNLGAANTLVWMAPSEL